MSKDKPDQSVTPEAQPLDVVYFRGALHSAGIVKSGRKGVRLWPELVQAALDRLGTRRLTLAEQRIVERATASFSKVRVPDWWGTESESAE